MDVSLYDDDMEGEPGAYDAEMLLDAQDADTACVGVPINDGLI